MKYIEKHFCLRIHRRDGTSKLLLGVTGNPPKVGSIKTVRVARDEVLKVKLVEHPRRDEPAEAIEVYDFSSPFQKFRIGVRSHEVFELGNDHLRHRCRFGLLLEPHIKVYYNEGRKTVSSKSRCAPDTHGHQPGKCKNLATEPDRMCKPCHDKTAD